MEVPPLHYLGLGLLKPHWPATEAVAHVGQTQNTQQFPSLMKLLSYFLYVLYNQNTLLPLKPQYTLIFHTEKKLVANGTVRTS